MSRYLDTTRLRQVIADGHTLDSSTVLDLLTRLERYQDAELQQLAKEPGHTGPTYITADTAVTITDKDTP